MVVAQVVSSLVLGGLESVAVSLANGLARRGFGSHLIATRELGPNAERLEPGVGLLCARRTGRFDPVGLARIVRYVDRHRIEVLEAHNRHSAALALVVRRLARTHPAVVLHDHSGPLIGTTPGRLERLLLGRLDAVIAVADGLRERGIALGLDPGRCVLVPNGVDLPPPGRAPAPRPTVVQVANLLPPKGHDVAVRAAARLRREFPGLRWVLIGRIPEPPTPYLLEVDRLVADLDLAEVVERVGVQRDVGPWWRQGRVAVLSSDREGLPMVVLEALAHGTPVVMTDVGDGPGLLRRADAGLVVPVRDPEALADAVGALLRDPERAEAMGRRGRALVEAELTTDRMVDRVAEVLALATRQ